MIDMGPEGGEEKCAHCHCPGIVLQFIWCSKITYTKSSLMIFLQQFDAIVNAKHQCGAALV